VQLTAGTALYGSGGTACFATLAAAMHILYD
jgi:hypothetical protein